MFSLHCFYGFIDYRRILILSKYTYTTFNRLRYNYHLIFNKHLPILFPHKNPIYRIRHRQMLLCLSPVQRILIDSRINTNYFIVLSRYLGYSYNRYIITSRHQTRILPPTSPMKFLKAWCRNSLPYYPS